jgi:GNAT superfamily N-acetyltransferase
MWAVSQDYVLTRWGTSANFMSVATLTTDEYEISTDRGRLDVGMIYEFLSSSYWARGIPRAVVERSIQNSLCFGVFHKGRQVGFARVITDYATFAYLADVFVVPGHRGRGISKTLVREILAHPGLQGLRRVLLATFDAHGLYARFGFGPLEHPEHYMTIHHPDVYQQGGGNFRAGA